MSLRVLFILSLLLCVTSQAGYGSSVSLYRAHAYDAGKALTLGKGRARSGTSRTQYPMASVEGTVTKLFPGELEDAPTVSPATKLTFGAGSLAGGEYTSTATLDGWGGGQYLNHVNNVGCDGGFSTDYFAGAACGSGDCTMSDSNLNSYPYQGDTAVQTMYPGTGTNWVKVENSTTGAYEKYSFDCP